MSAFPLSLAAVDAVDDTEFIPVGEFPDYVRRLPGTSDFLLATLSGDRGEAGSVSAVRLTTGGLTFTDLPLQTATYLAAGTLVVTNEDGSTFEVAPGEGYFAPGGWSGQFVVTSPVTMFLHA